MALDACVLELQIKTEVLMYLSYTCISQHLPCYTFLLGPTALFMLSPQFLTTLSGSSVNPQKVCDSFERWSMLLPWCPSWYCTRIQRKTLPCYLCYSPFFSVSMLTSQEHFLAWACQRVWSVTELWWWQTAPFI